MEEKMNNSQFPMARKTGLVVQEMPDELLVYDLDSNKAHCLNQTAAFVWKSCDGSNSVADITELFVSEGGSKISEDLVWLAIDQLNENQLLEKEMRSSFAGQSRRDVIKKIGLASMVAIPIVASLVAPQSALAASSCLCPSGATCTGDLECAGQGGGCGSICQPSGVCANTGTPAPCPPPVP
jgi:hypothetical protein